MVLLRDLCFRLGGRLSIFVLLRLTLLLVCRTGSQQKKTAAPVAPFHIASSTRNLNQRTKLLELHVAVKVTAGQNRIMIYGPGVRSP
jgi:hypothetical protein